MAALSVSQRADLIGGTSLPAIAGIIYGVARLVEHGRETLALVLVGGGIVSLILVQTSVWVFYSPPGRSWRGALAALGSLGPYAYSLLLGGYLGLWSLWQTVAHGGPIGTIGVAIFWTLVGWRMLFVLGRITRRERPSH